MTRWKRWILWKLVAPPAVVLACTTPSAAQAPDGMEVVVLANDLGIHSRSDINDRGEVVWSSSFPFDESDVWLFSEGIIRKISEPDSYDVNPAINNNGVVAWMRCESYFAKACELVTWEDGVITHVPTPVTIDQTPDINDAGHIVFAHDFSETFDDVELFLYDGQTVEQITDNGYANQVPRINSQGDIAWIRYDFGQSPWVSVAVARLAGKTIELTDGSGSPQGIDINDSVQIVFRQSNGVEYVLRLWEKGKITTVGPGSNPSINTGGDMYYDRWSDAKQMLEPILLLGEKAYLLPSPTGWGSASGAINDMGEVAWREFDDVVGDTQIVFLRRIASKGDFNGDCHADWYDFRVFQTCFTGPDDGPPGGFLADCARGDFDDDGDIDLMDFEHFLGEFTGPEIPIPDCEKGGGP